MKRSKSPRQPGISPPPTKRKIESTTTNKAVASFFKPASQKEPETITWRIVDKTLIIGRSEDPAAARTTLAKPVKVAAFDLDDTIITPINPGRTWNRSATSWKWWDSCVPGRLKELHQNGYLIVLISNQGNISLKDDPRKLQHDTASFANLKAQLSSILRQLDIPVSVYAATGQDRYRKPRIGMWQEMREDYDLESDDAVDLQNSFYIGDAAGREKTDKRRKDHAISDRDLAANIGIGFQTPEEFFRNESVEPYVHSFEPATFLAQQQTSEAGMPLFTKINSQELVIFCGSPGAGKSSFYWKVLQVQGYERVNQDILKTRERCLKVARENLRAGSSVAVDNTNADVETRAHWINLAKECEVPIRCIRFTASARLCEHNDSVRAHNSAMNPEKRTLLPGIAFRSFVQRFVEPRMEEGFQDITYVDFETKNVQSGPDTGSLDTRPEHCCVAAYLICDWKQTASCLTALQGYNLGATYLRALQPVLEESRERWSTRPVQ